MDKGFNDDELADIMSEIESLEKDYQDTEPVAVEVSEHEDIVVEQEKPEVVAELKEFKKPTPSNTTASAPAFMSFNVEGEMKMKMHFEVNGQSVELEIRPDEGLVIEMDGGASFKVPFTSRKSA